MGKRSQIVMGVHAPPARLTGMGRLFALLIVILAATPVFGVLAFVLWALGL